MSPKERWTRFLLLVAFLAMVLLGTIRSSRFPYSSVQQETATKPDAAAAVKLENVVATQPTKVDFPDTSCRRPCHHYKNRVDLTSGNAGLKDRTYVMQAWGNLASFLCARVVIPPPARFLTAKHETAGKAIHPNLTFEKDLLYFANVDNISDIVVSDLMKYDKPMQGWGITRQSNTRNIYNHLQELYNHTVQQQHNESIRPFYWKIQANFFSYREVFLGHFERLRQKKSYSRYTSSSLMAALPKQLPKFTRFSDDRGCVYAKKVEAISNVVIARRVVERLEDTYGRHDEHKPFLFGYLHVRRTDQTWQCPTDLPTMRAYLNCTFHNFCRQETADCNVSVPLLVGSDEKDQNYRQNLLSAIDELHGLEAVDMDAVVREELGRTIQGGEGPSYRNSNFVVFLIGKLVIQQAAFYLQRHRSHCRPCDAHLVVLDQNETRRWWSSWLPMNVNTYWTSP